MNVEEEQKTILNKIVDYKRVGMLCLFLSAFLYVGTFIPPYHAIEWKLEVLSGVSLLFLISSFICCWRSTKLKEKLQ
ncbi:hypothetical protein C0674_09640 [Sporolactobacillus terrae]|uniref:YrhC-like protein n=1 Tax=Sporolactobacillus terrae TaxID=269673 RepID=A0ABX5Q888_9BACL|nr:hypothetical protein C0674_09640 [Sporolactobacillus terrae]QAA25837.1 hypothetical protein C0679_09620 [Sporolactobacillus terrae]